MPNIAKAEGAVSAPASDAGEEKDPLEEMLDRTGCKKPHIALQECMYEHRDWRKCQNLVNELRDCMLDYEMRRQQGLTVDGEENSSSKTVPNQK